MAQILFSFSVSTETQEAAFAGNISIQEALQLLQQLAISDAVRQATQSPVELPQEEEERK